MAQRILNNLETRSNFRSYLNDMFTELYANQGLAKYNIVDYGGSGDGQYHASASITSGTATLTASSGVFVAGDVGKSIRVGNAGTGGDDLITTIAGFTSATVVTLTDNASTTASSEEIYWGTDNTGPLQDAIEAAIANINGEVFLPFTGSAYYLFGSLVTSADGVNPNAQVYIPTNLSLTIQPHVIIKGEIPPSVVYGGNSTFVIDEGGSVTLHSMILNGGTAPAVIGSTWNTTGGGGVVNFNVIRVTFENIHVRIRSRTSSANVAPILTAFDMSRPTAASFYSCYVTSETALKTASVEPTDINQYGFKLPNRLNSAGGIGGNIVDNCGAFGVYNGFIFSDHATIGTANASGTIRGFVFTENDNPVFAHKLLSTGTRYPFAFTGACQVFINSAFFEDNGSDWYTTNTVFYNPTNVPVSGYIYYFVNGTYSISGNYGTDFNIFNIEDQIGKVAFSESAGGSSTVASFSPRHFPSSMAAHAQSNVGTVFVMGPVGTGTSATFKSSMEVNQTDVFASTSNYSKLGIIAAGTNGYRISARRNGSGSLHNINFQMDDVTKFNLKTDGSIGLDRTITTGGTTGNQTINRMAGTVNIAAAGTSVTVTNSLVDANSLVYAFLRTDDATATGIKCVVPGSGSFVITLTAAATSEVSIGFIVFNGLT